MTALLARKYRSSVRVMYASPHLVVKMLIWDVTGFQEGLVRQVDDMATLLGDEWSWVSVKCTG